MKRFKLLWQPNLTFLPSPEFAMQPPLNTANRTTRNTCIALGVVAAHGLGIWLLQAATQNPTEAPDVPVSVMAELLPAQAEQTKVVQPAPPLPKTVSAPTLKVPAPKTPAPVKQAKAETAATPEASAQNTSTVAAPSTASAPTAQPVSGQSTTSSTQTPAPAKVELPSSSADYLNNPRPPYPPMSKRLNEQGKVVLRVLIEPDGSASKAEIRTGSGYERLDQAALQTVLRWRYVPGKRNGVPEAMWFNVPINFVLE